jgi:hypothetical protein
VESLLEVRVPILLVLVKFRIALKFGFSIYHAELRRSQTGHRNSPIINALNHVLETFKSTDKIPVYIDTHERPSTTSLPILASLNWGDPIFIPEQCLRLVPKNILEAACSFK